MYKSISPYFIVSATIPKAQSEKEKTDIDPIEFVDTNVSEEHSIETIEGGVQATNVGFSDAVENTYYSIGNESIEKTFADNYTNYADLQKFLSRPIQIFERTWSSTDNFFFDQIFPWVSFITHPTVAKKLDNFKLLQATLKIRIMVNGSPFHYGRLFVGVRPSEFDNNYTTQTPTTAATIDNYRDTNNPGQAKQLIPLRTLYSQRPHVFIDPSTSQPQTISWPFFTPYNWIDLQDAQTMASLGALEIWNINDLRHANAPSAEVNITFYAWLEDVKLGGLTSQNVDIPFAQSGRVAKDKATRKPIVKDKTKKNPPTTGSTKDNSSSDEYRKDGVISSLATTVAKGASYLYGIPTIGKYAKATSIAANAIGDVARMFGFSRPAVLSDTQFFRPQTIGNLSNTSGADPLMKLTLDPKQEITIDPSTVNLSCEDELAFAVIGKKEALIDTFQWTSVGPAQNAGLLESVLVHPCVAPAYNSTSSTIQTCTPVSFITHPFTHWTGSLRYRFQIVASQFHRGRLLFVYEPNSNSAGLEADVNTRFSHVLDIAEDRDVTFEVNWTQTESYRFVSQRVLEGVANVVTGPFPGDMFFGLGDNTSNGRLMVYVLNKLNGPTDDTTVDINVYVSAGDSFQVRNPNSDYMGFQTYANTANSPFVEPVNSDGPTLYPRIPFAQADIIGEEENAPMQSKVVVINGEHQDVDHDMSSNFFGEVVTTFRTLLKRYVYLRSLPLTEQVDSYTSHDLALQNFPNGPGPTYGSSYVSFLTPRGGVNYNICILTYLRYICSAFVGWRGGIRHKLVVRDHSNNACSLSVSRSNFVFNNEFETTINTSTSDSVPADGLSSIYNITTMGGAAVTHSAVNPSLEYEIPFQAGIRYAEVNSTFVATFPYRDNPLNTSFDSHFVHYSGTQGNANVGDLFGIMDQYVAGGEDLSFFFFIGAPPLMRNDGADPI